MISAEMLLEREKNPEEASQKMSRQRSLSRSVQRGRRKVRGKWFLIKKNKKEERTQKTSVATLSHVTWMLRTRPDMDPLL